MRILKVSEDVVPVGQFKAQAKKWLARANETGQPLVITQNGRPAAVMLSPAEYDRLTYQERFVADIREGMAEADAGRGITLEESKARLLKRPKRHAR